MNSKSLSRAQRLQQASLFGEAFAQKECFPGRTLVLWLRRGTGASLRLGVISSRKVSNRAVDRNLARRRLREIFRHHRAELEGEADVVIIARRNLLAASYGETEAEFLKLARKAGLFPVFPENEIRNPKNPSTKE